LFADTMISPPRTGARDNAAGVAAVLELAQRHGGKLEHFDVMVLFTGASAHFALGMRNWLKRHRSELEPTAIAIVSVDAVGTGTAHYATKEGPVFASRLHPTLVALCSEDENATPYVSRELSDAYAARAFGLPAVRISGATQKGTGTDDVDRDALAGVTDFVSGLVERIDAEVGPQL
jgi:Zn-dependent M28 family amino/carboxypeptidase